MKQKEQKELILRIKKKYEEEVSIPDQKIPSRMRFGHRNMCIEVCDCGNVITKSTYGWFGTLCKECGASKIVNMISEIGDDGNITCAGTRDCGQSVMFDVIDKQKGISAFTLVQKSKEVYCPPVDQNALLDAPVETVINSAKAVRDGKSSQTVRSIILFDNDKVVEYVPDDGKSEYKRRGSRFVYDVYQFMNERVNKDLEEQFAAVYGDTPTNVLGRIFDSAERNRVKKEKERLEKQKSTLSLFPEVPEDWSLADTMIVNTSPIYGVPRYTCFCNMCGSQFVVGETGTASNGFDAVCPNCGSPIIEDGNKVSRSDLIEQDPLGVCSEKTTDVCYWSALADGSLGIQIVRYSTCFDRDFENGGDLKRKMSEILRFRFAKGCADTYRKNVSDNEMLWEKLTKVDSSRYSYYGYRSRLTQSIDEIVGVVKKTELANTGLVEVIRMYMNDDNGNGNAWSDDIIDRMGTYVTLIAECPAVELIAKSGLDSILRYGILNQWNSTRKNGLVNTLKKRYHDGATTPAQILNVSKWAFKKAREYNLSINELNSLRTMQNVDPSATWEDYDLLRNENLIGSYRWHEIARTYNIPIRKILTYLDQVYMYQCIDRIDALMLWGDYLYIAKELAYDLKDKSRLYPTSLKKAHDVATFAHKKLANDNVQRQFASVCENNASLEYRGKTLSVVIPHKAEDLTREGTSLKHCVRTYVERIANRNTFVCFVRKNDELDTPFYTVEVKNGTVLQVRGYCNKRATREVAQFVSEWAWARQLTCNY